MTVPFRIEIEDRAVIDALNRLAAAGRDLTPAMRAIATALLSQTEDNFSAEAGPLGKWPAVKDKKRQGGKILQDTGRLAASVTPFWSATEAGIGSNAVYAAIHQLGGTIGKAAQSRMVRHRVNAKGELLRSEALGGKGLVFAKKSHKRVAERWFEQGAHTITIPARPYMPVGPDGQLQAGMEDQALDAIQAHLLGAV